MSECVSGGLLRKAYLQGRLSHAYLLSGIAGLGKTQFAREFADFLLCEKHETPVCGKCRGCVLMKANHHPDLIMVSPEEKSRVIKIDQIREVSMGLSKTTHAGGYRVVIIAPADTMPVQAANALLKTLEEPTPKTVIFLIDDQNGVLPSTIHSRCQKIIFSDDHQLMQNNHPVLLRKQLLEHLEKIQLKRVNPIQFDLSWLKMPLENILSCLLLLCVDLSRLQLSAEKTLLVFQDHDTVMKSLCEKISATGLQHMIKKIMEKKSIVAKGIHLNQQLCLEDIFIEWERHVH